MCEFCQADECHSETAAFCYYHLRLFILDTLNDAMADGQTLIQREMDDNKEGD